MAQLEVVFSGLVAFAPCREGGSSLVRVLFPDLDVARQVLLSSGAFTMPRHRPRLRFAAGHLAEENERRLDWLVDDLNGNAEYHVFLEDEDISFVTDNPTKSFSIVRNQAGPFDQKPNPELPLEDYLKAKSDFKWVADMSRVLPGRARIDRDCVCDNRLELIKVRVLLDDGSLATFRLAGGEEANEMNPEVVDIYKFEVPDVDRAYEQTLAEQVILRVPLAAPKVIVFSLARSGDQPPKRLILQGETIRLYIENIDAESILEGRREIEQDGIDEMGMFYELCDQRPVRSRRISPFRSGGGGGQRICPSCGFPEEDFGTAGVENA